MRNGGLANNLSTDGSGAAFIEFAAVFPLLMLVVLGTVDLSLLMIDWSNFSSATYVGARFAAVSDPVATGINNDTAAASSATAGQSCIDVTSGAASGNCVTLGSTCATTGASTTVACTNSTFTASSTALDAIVAAMNATLVEKQIDRRQVIVAYTPTNLGYVMRPGGSPMNITLSLRCVRHDFYFITSLMRWVFSTPESQCTGIGGSTGVALPTFSTTLPSEDLTTN
jgi:Flp pilus assembly protein TadG